MSSMSTNQAVDDIQQTSSMSIIYILYIDIVNVETSFADADDVDDFLPLINDDGVHVEQRRLEYQLEFRRRN